MSFRNLTLKASASLMGYRYVMTYVMVKTITEVP